MSLVIKYFMPEVQRKKKKNYFLAVNLLLSHLIVIDNYAVVFGTQKFACGKP